MYFFFFSVSQCLCGENSLFDCCRTASTHFSIRCTASSISCSVNIADKLKRIAERNRSSETPIASNTGDGNKLPDEHAEPVEHAMPAKSKLTSKTSDRQPRNERFTVVGKLQPHPLAPWGKAVFSPPVCGGIKGG